MDEQKEVEELAGVIYSQTNYDHGMPWCKMLARNLLENGYRKPSAVVGLDEKKIYESLEVLNIVLAGNGISNLSKIQMSAISETICSKFSPQPPAIKLPENLDTEEESSYHCKNKVEYVKGWNACLEAVQRMNGGKG